MGLPARCGRSSWRVEVENRELWINIRTPLPSSLDAAYVQALVEMITELLPTGAGNITADIVER